MRSSLLVLFVLACSCDPPPARTASGELIDSVAWQERFARTNDARDTRLTGKALEKAVPLLDQNQVTALHGEFAASGKIDEASLVFTVQARNKPERTVIMKNCAETHVCAFLKAAVRDGVTERLPGLCKSAPPCNGE